MKIYKNFGKRTVDLTMSCVGIILVAPLVIFCICLSAYTHGGNGIFVQKRVGKGGKIFKIIKIQTMFPGDKSTITVLGKSRISGLGRVLRRLKIDELPQLFNVIKGEMSLVGPRPDVPAMYEDLDYSDDILFSVRPGITGPAQLKFRNEEELLAQFDNPEKYAVEELWPMKLEINRLYAQEFSFCLDLELLIKTVTSR